VDPRGPRIAIVFPPHGCQTFHTLPHIDLKIADITKTRVRCRIEIGHDVLQSLNERHKTWFLAHECANELFHHWHRVKKGTLIRSSFRFYASRLRVEVRDLLLDGATLEHGKVAVMCKEILKVESAL